MLEATEEGDYSVALPTLSKAFAIIDKNVKRGIVHKNTAARKKSQLHLKVSLRCRRRRHRRRAAVTTVAAIVPALQFSGRPSLLCFSGGRASAAHAPRTQTCSCAMALPLTHTTGSTFACLQVKALEGGAPAAPAAPAAAE